MWTETASVAGSRPDLLAPFADHGQRRRHPVGRERVEVQLVREARGEAPRHLRPVAADEDRDARLLEALRLVDGVVDVGACPVPGRAARAEHPGDDLELVREDREPLRRRREAVAVRQPLVFLPARADPEDRPPAADHVDRRDRLGRQSGVPVRGREDEVPEARPAGLHGERGELRERLEDRRFLRRRVDLHVVVDPERLEPGVLGPAGDLDGPPPRGRRVDAEVLPVAALGQRQSQLHAIASDAKVRSTSSRSRARCSSVTGTTSATVNHRPASRT